MKNKLIENFWALTHFQKIIYILFIRPFTTKKDRIFFDGPTFFLPGQMYKAERKALYEVVKSEKPDYCFEIGTFTGGGSTFFISEALRSNNYGKLFTIESDENLVEKATRKYRRYIPLNLPYIDFIKADSPDVFIDYLKQNDKKKFIFLDGAEDGAQTLEQYEFFKPYMKSGDVLALHDWNTEKTIKVKPVLLSETDLEKVIELGKPESIGFVVFKKI